MDLRYPDFAGSLEWNRLASFERSVQILAGGRSYTPLAPFVVPTTHRAFLIGVTTETPGSERWIRGGWATAFSSQRPDSLSELLPKVQLAAVQLRLGAFVPLLLPPYGRPDSVVELRFPYYFRHVYFEIWWYDGQIIDPAEQIQQLVDRPQDWIQL